jgi:hypothetical protein
MNAPVAWVVDDTGFSKKRHEWPESIVAKLTRLLIHWLTGFAYQPLINTPIHAVVRERLNLECE